MLEIGLVLGQAALAFRVKLTLKNIDPEGPEDRPVKERNASI
jgi:hypothetical protein